MVIDRQFFQFYKPYLKRISYAIRNGKSQIFVGINSIGKTLLVNQILSKNFRDKFLRKQKTHFVFWEFKDKNPHTAQQLYKYCLIQTAKVLGEKLPPKETFNDFSFYLLMSEMVKKLGSDEKVVFILLDFQQLLSQEEPFFKSLIYLEWYSYGKVSYLVLSEPQILDSRNPWVQKFIQRFTNHKFIFLPTFDRKTILVDIEREENFNKSALNRRHHSIIIRHSQGLHGVIGAFCYLLKDNPQVATIKQLMKIVDNDKMCNFWFKDLLDSLPRQSIKILKAVGDNKKKFKKLGKYIYGRWLVDLGFLKKDGTFSFKFLLPVLNQYEEPSDKDKRQLKLQNNLFYANGDKVDLTKKEFLVLRLLYKSKSKFVSYDKIGEVLWKENPDKFSLWAISQIIRRLRKKLSDYFIPPQTIRSVRGEGYILN